MNSTTPETSSPPKRHWCFTTWLILAFIANIYLATRLGLIFGAVNIIFIFALYQWQKWGFYGLFIIATVMLILGLTNGVAFWKASSGLVAVMILYGVLNMGGDKKAWPHLKW
jgi:hypothetical protein